MSPLFYLQGRIKNASLKRPSKKNIDIRDGMRGLIHYLYLLIKTLFLSIADWTIYLIDYTYGNATVRITQTRHGRMDLLWSTGNGKKKKIGRPNDRFLDM